MHSEDIRKNFLAFFEKRGHKIIPSASLVPENDPSVLFNTAGMQPLVPYLLGEKHPMGGRLANVQKCVRTQDIDEVGDKTHDTFFEMLGNWSLGDYFKEEAIQWSYELLTSKKEGFGLDPERLYITVFEGDENAPVDTQSKDLWMKAGVPERRIYFMPAKSNWWSAGDNGPCGPDTEMFYDLTGKLGDMTKEEYMRADEKQEVVEIWNDVFMEYEKKDGKVVGRLKNKNVDTGAGLERLAMVLQGKDNIFETDLFAGTMAALQKEAKKYAERPARIVADHIRTSIFMIADGVLPANNARGYILRRLLRRAVRFADVLGLAETSINTIVDTVIAKYGNVYTNLTEQSEKIKETISQEEKKFRRTLAQGLKEFEKGTDPFVLATTYGFPIELTEELAKENGESVDLEDFKKKMAEHQKLSQTASAGMFKGGLANHSEKTVRHHTAHHLLLAALQEIVGPEVKQRGSNINEERLRMDFLSDRKITPEEQKKIEDWVNDKIARGLTVVRREMKKEEAERIGAQMEFGAKYADVVSVYFIEDQNGTVYSKEFCGGPHVKNTAELYASSREKSRNGSGPFKILKEEAVSQGIRRIKATLE